MKICLFGGTFDPPHIGHLLIAQTVFEAEKFDKVIFVPANKPPNKKAFSPQATRVEMLKLAVEGNPNFEISDIEIERGGTEPIFAKKIRASLRAGVRDQSEPSLYCLLLSAARPTLPNLANKLVDAHPALPLSLEASPGEQESSLRKFRAVVRMVLMQSSLG